MIVGPLKDINASEVLVEGFLNLWTFDAGFSVGHVFDFFVFLEILQKLEGKTLLFSPRGRPRTGPDFMKT